MSKGTGIKGMTVPHLSRANRAQELRVAREARTPQQQLALLDERPGKASRERRRLLGLVAASQGPETDAGAGNPNQRQRRRAAKRKTGEK